MKRLVILLVHFYRRFLKPIMHALGGPLSGCRFHPSCSQYCVEAVERHGVAYGLWLTLKRLLRCHPWGACGQDPVPPLRPKRQKTK